MITKKLFLCGILGTATLFSTASFAFHHSHHHRPRMHYNHHHHNAWRGYKFHGWEPHRNQIIVRSGIPYGHVHRHY